MRIPDPRSPSQAAGAEVRVLRGIPGTPVAVHVNGERALDELAPGTTTDPLGLAAGSYEVAVFPADAADDPEVDVSLEPHDGDPAHSGDSVLRGPLPA